MRVELAGDCTVARAEELQATLLEALRSGEDIEVGLGAVTAIDLSFCQLLHALRASCEAKGSAFSLAGSLPGGLEELAMLCGLPDIAGSLDQEASQRREAGQ